MHLSQPSFASIVFVIIIPSCISAYKKVLQYQCWHELPPFLSFELQSSRDGTFEFQVNQETTTTGQGKDIPDNPHFPWSYAPICTESLPDLGSKLCVYTNTSFSNGRGISIFTTPSIASEFANLPAFQDPTTLQEKNINTNSGVWTTTSLPGRGIGMLASKPLKFGDRITAYTPALLAHLESDLGTLEREKYFRLAVSQLPSATQNDFLNLSYVYGDERIRAQDIVKANTFQLQLGESNHLAVFPETSRLNHACAPNAQYYLDPSLLTHFVHATRPIAEGEEILISYTSPLELTEVRQQHLQEGFHFKCACPRCTNPHISDDTLSKMLDMQNSLNDWSPPSLGSPALSEQLLSLYRQQGLQGFLDVPYGFAALAYNAVGESEKAAEYAEMAKESILMKDGAWSRNLGLWNELLEGPEKHWSYRRRL
jgi:hypothetical protein